MAINSLSSLSSLRMSGLASGMDTESMVESLMRVERMRYDKLVKQKTIMDWKKEANLEANNQLRTFRDDFLSVLKQDNYMLSGSAVMKYKVKMDASASVTVTAGKDALPGSHTINSITSIASAANAASGAAISAGTVSIDTALSDLALNNALDFSGGDISFKINGQSFTFSATDTLRTVINRVNSNADANVQMGFSSLTGKITVTNRKLGAATNLVIENVTGNAFSDTNAAFGIAAGTYANGTDAVLRIDGVDVVKDTNSFSIDGIGYSLKAATATATSFAVEQDVDGAVDTVKKFVDSYNTMIAKLEDMLTEDRNSDYEPLTDEEMESMSEAQVEKWEGLAKSGMLRNDSHVRKLLQDLRKGFFETVSSAGISPSSIGLSTVSYTTKGMIQVDETKLRDALQRNPQQVADVLTKLSASSDATTKFSESGLAGRMLTTINSYISDYQGYRTESMNDQYDRLEDSMERMERVLKNKEERYWSQFNRMEQALSQMNSQSSWLAQQFASN